MQIFSTNQQHPANHIIHCTIFSNFLSSLQKLGSALTIDPVCVSSTFYRASLDHFVFFNPNRGHVIIWSQNSLSWKSNRSRKRFATVTIMLNRRMFSPSLPDVFVQDYLIGSMNLTRFVCILIFQDFKPRFSPTRSSIV